MENIKDILNSIKRHTDAEADKGAQNRSIGRSLVKIGMQGTKNVWLKKRGRFRMILNSINEKCARIRGAFVGEFDDYMAKYYYIDGKRGEVKKIALPRDLVIWE